MGESSRASCMHVWSLVTFKAIGKLSPCAFTHPCAPRHLFAAPGKDKWYIKLDFVGDFTNERRAVFENAATRLVSFSQARWIS